MSISSSQDIIKDLDVLSPAADSMNESSIPSSSDDDSSSKQDRNQVLEPSVELSVPQDHTVVLEEELAEHFTALVTGRPMNDLVESCIVEDQKQYGEESPAISFDTTTPVLACQVTSDSSDPNNHTPLISNNLELVKNLNHASVHHNGSSNALSGKTSAGSVSSHHVSSVL